MKRIRSLGLLFGLIFLGLFLFRTGFWGSSSLQKAGLPISSIDTLPEKDAWMNIFQAGRKIGYAHTVLKRTGSGYQLTEDVFMRINTMDVAQDLKLKTQARMKPDLTLDSFDFEISSGRFQFTAKGRVSEYALLVNTKSGDSSQEVSLPLDEKPYLAAGIMHAVAESTPAEGEIFRYAVFDPSAMKTETVHIRVYGVDEIRVSGENYSAQKIILQYKGVSQTAWISEQGDVLKEEGLLGIYLEKTSPEEALFGLPIQASQDLTKIASVPANVHLKKPVELNQLVIKISGVVVDEAALTGSRQTISKGRLVIQKEKLPAAQAMQKMDNDATSLAAYLKPSAFIQSDHPKIREIIDGTLLPDDDSITKIQKLMAWIDQHIEKRPVLSMPDAVSTLENRMGDCNEHAVLLAALSRAAGIPADVEAGLVYMKGRFYYHAWNRLYFGRWITADALFGQIPADVTHIRFAIGTENFQQDLVHLIDNVKIEVVDYK